MATRLSDGVSVQPQYNENGDMTSIFVFSPPDKPKTAGIKNADRMVKLTPQAAYELHAWLDGLIVMGQIG